MKSARCRSGAPASTSRRRSVVLMVTWAWGLAWPTTNLLLRLCLLQKTRPSRSRPRRPPRRRAASRRTTSSSRRRPPRRRPWRWTWTSPLKQHRSSPSAWTSTSPRPRPILIMAVAHVSIKWRKKSGSATRTASTAGSTGWTASSKVALCICWERSASRAKRTDMPRPAASCGTSSGASLCYLESIQRPVAVTG